MDIISLPIEYDKKKIDSRYRLVIIASQRGRELYLGAKPRISEKTKKVTTTAILESITNKIEFITGHEAALAIEKAEKIDYRKLIEEKRRPIVDLSSLEKDLKVYLHERETVERELEDLFTEVEGKGESSEIEEE